MAHRSGEWRRRHSVGAWAVDGRLGGGVPPHHRADGLRERLACRNLVLRPRMERADAHQARLLVRAGDEAPSSADVCTNCDHITTLNAEPQSTQRLFGKKDSANSAALR